MVATPPTREPPRRGYMAGVGGEGNGAQRRVLGGAGLLLGGGATAGKPTAGVATAGVMGRARQARRPGTPPPPPPPSPLWRRSPAATGAAGSGVRQTAVPRVRLPAVPWRTGWPRERAGRGCTAGGRWGHTLTTFAEVGVGGRDTPLSRLEEGGVGGGGWGVKWFFCCVSCVVPVYEGGCARPSPAVTAVDMAGWERFSFAQREGARRGR